MAPRAAQKAINNQRRTKLLHQLQHRHQQLKSPNMKLQTFSNLDRKDNDYKAAFSQQDRANKMFRGTTKYSEAWKSGSKTMILTDVNKYTTALRDFLDDLNEHHGVAVTMPPTPDMSVATLGQLSKVQPTHRMNRATSKMPSGDMPPTPTPSTATAIQLPSRAATPLHSSRATAVPRSNITPQPDQSPQQSQKRAGLFPPSISAAPNQPNMSKKRKADDDADQDFMANLAKSLRDEGKRARLDNELAKSGLRLSIGPLSEQVIKGEPKHADLAGHFGLVSKVKIKEEPKEFDYSGARTVYGLPSAKRIKEEPKGPEENHFSTTYHSYQKRARIGDINKYRVILQKEIKVETKETEEMEDCDFEFI